MMLHMDDQHGRPTARPSRVDGMGTVRRVRVGDLRRGDEFFHPGMGVWCQVMWKRRVYDDVFTVSYLPVGPLNLSPRRDRWEENMEVDTPERFW